MKKYILSLITGLCTWGLQAQQTGNFNTTLSFMGQTRTLSCHVPANYDADSTYKLMICLHGLGDNSTNYRNALITTAWTGLFPNTIFVCPDGGNADFYAQTGSELIIQEAIDFAMQNYTIDSGHVVLQGFSLGGRSALAYGLDYPSKFRGLLLNTPAVQGANDAFNDPAAGVIYNYANAAQIPMVITSGDQDFLYDYTLKEAVIPTLKKNDARMIFSSVVGMGHTVPTGPSSATAGAYAFFDDQASVDYDIDLFDVDAPLRICGNNLEANCFIQNKGNAPVTSVDIYYTIGSVTGVHTWSGSLGFYEHVEVTLPIIITSGGGVQTLQLEIGDVNNVHTDSLIDDNVIDADIQIEIQGRSLPVFQGFESGMDGWLIHEGPSLFFWFTDNMASKNGMFSMAAFNTILLFYTSGNRERFESPLLNLTTIQKPFLKFDVAFNYHRYTPPVTTMDTSFTDTLEVLISTDCGATFQPVYRKGGEDLATATTPILNALSLPAVFFNPSSSQWREEIIDLTPFSSEEDVIIRFDYISSLGGSIYIDDILIDGNLSVESNEESNPSFQVYPNPASDVINIENTEGDIAVRIVDASGKVVLPQQSFGHSQTTRQLDISQLPAGMYMVEITAGRDVKRLKVMVSR